MEYFAKKYEVTTRTLHNWFKGFWTEEVQIKNLSISNEIVIIDGFVLENNCVVLLAKTKERVIFWQFVKRETYSAWSEFLSSLNGHPKVIVCDGQKGMLKAIKELFPRVIIQRCHFHIQQRNRSLLTMNPELKPSIEFNQIVKNINKINTRDELKDWINDYLNWRKNYDEFLKEKTYLEFDTEYIL